VRGCGEEVIAGSATLKVGETLVFRWFRAGGKFSMAARRSTAPKGYRPTGSRHPFYGAELFVKRCRFAARCFGGRRQCSC
jgi:hypothetical protein